MERKINIARFKEDSRTAEVKDIWQWDYGQILRIQGLNLPTAVEIHFSLDEHGGEAARRIGVTKDGVTDVVVPDTMLENESAYGDSYYFFAYIYLADETSGNTEYKIRAKVSTRSKPEGYNSGDSTFAAILKTVNEIADEKVTTPDTAKVGQILAVKKTDESGKPTEFEATDTSGGVSDEKIAEAVGTYMEEHPIEETDPTVPDWAKQPEKPSYTASEVGALPDTTKIPSKTSDLQNDSGFLTEHQDLSGYALKSEVPKSASDVGADAAGTAESKVSVHNTATDSHNDIRELIDAITVPTKLSELENDSGYAKTTDIPDKLPNPHKLTFSGAVKAEYDGTEPLTVEIPSGGGGGDSWELVNSVTTSEEVTTVEISTNSNGETFSHENILVAIYVPYGASITGQVNFINQWKTITVSGIAISATVFNENRRNLVEFRTEYFGGITFTYTRKNLGEAVFLSNSGKTNKYPISSVKVITSNSAMLPVGTFVGVYRK